MSDDTRPAEHGDERSGSRTASTLPRRETRAERAERRLAERLRTGPAPTEDEPAAPSSASSSQTTDATPSDSGRPDRPEPGGDTHGTGADDLDRLDAEEPAVLGAAPTLPFRRETRAERAQRKPAQRAPASPPTPPGVAPGANGAGAAPPPDYSGVEYVFEPHVTSMPPLGQYLRDLWGRRRFMRELARAQLQRERSRTIFGALWGIIDPLMLSALYIVVFTIIREGARPTEFIPLLIAGIIMFQILAGAMNAGGGAITGSSNLMLNSTFPRALLPITVVYKSLIKFLPVIPVYTVIYWVMPTEPSWALLLFPVLFSIQIVLCVGLALLTSALIVYFQDVKNMMNYVSRALMLCSPIIWPVSFMPDEMRRFLVWQPAFSLFASYQEMFGGTVPGQGQVIQAALWAFFFLILGAWVFLRHERDFAVQL